MSTFTVNGNAFRVRLEPARSADYGSINYRARLVRVHTHDKFGYPYSEGKQHETFLHEVTHAVLHEMGHPQWNDETFVTTFAELLHEALSSYTTDTP